MGTGPQVLGNHKALPAVTYFYSAVIYSLRSLHIPLHQAGMAFTVQVPPSNLKRMFDAQLKSKSLSLQKGKITFPGTQRCNIYEKNLKHKQL
eukprot:scaffold80965_cov43-Attheya_sp.AAC.1